MSIANLKEARSADIYAEIQQLRAVMDSNLSGSDNWRAANSAISPLLEELEYRCRFHNVRTWQELPR